MEAPVSATGFSLEFPFTRESCQHLQLLTVSDFTGPLHSCPNLALTTTGGPPEHLCPPSSVLSIPSAYWAPRTALEGVTQAPPLATWA